MAASKRTETMPIFEYLCRDCGDRFEALVRGSAPPACPSCHSARLEQQVSVFAVGRGGARTSPSGGACGTCGDPRVPGSCDVN